MSCLCRVCVVSVSSLCRPVSRCLHLVCGNIFMAGNCLGKVQPLYSLPMLPMLPMKKVTATNSVPGRILGVRLLRGLPSIATTRTGQPLDIVRQVDTSSYTYEGEGRAVAA